MFDDIIAGIRYILTNFVLKEKADRKGPARVGEVRHWKGGYYKKHAERDWRPVPGPKGQAAHAEHEYPSGHTPEARDEGRARDEKDKIDADRAKHGHGEADRRHQARMHRMMEAIQDPHKAARRGAAFHAAGHPETAKKFLARAIELGGEETAAEPSEPSKPTTPGVPSTGNKPAAAHAAWSKLVKPSQHPSAKPAASAGTPPGGVAAEIKRRQLARVAQSIAQADQAKKEPEAKPAAEQHRGVTQLSQAERQIIAHAKASGNRELYLAERKKRRDRMVKVNRADRKAKAAAAAAGGGTAQRAAAEVEQKRKQLSMAELQALGEARAKGDFDRARAIYADRRKRKVKVYQDKFHGKGKAAKAAVQAAGAAGAAVPVQVPAPVGGAKPGKPEPRKAPVKPQPVSPPSGTSKNAAPLAGPKPPKFLGSSEKLETGIMDKVRVAAWTVKDNSNVNVTFFNKLENGLSVVFKPHKMGLDPAGPAMGRGAFYDFSVRETEREKCAYELDRVLGLGMTPPVVVRNDIIPREEMQKLMKTGKGARAAAAAGYKGGDHKTKGSAMYLVSGCKVWEDHDFNGEHLSSLPENTRFDMQKLACFDFITGTSDRHQRNWMVDKNNNLIAIDHGLCFPWTKDTSVRDPLYKFRSEPFDQVVDEGQGKIDNKILDHLKTIKKDQLLGVMKSYGLEKEGEHCWMRLQALVRAGSLSHRLESEKTWYRPEVLRA